MIKIYNRYIGNNSDFYRVDPLPSGSPGNRFDNSGKSKAFSVTENLFGSVSSLLPAGIDAGDVLILLVLLFLYIESKDEDFLIILAVLAFSILKKD